MAKYSGRNVQRLRRLIYARDNGICGICGEYADFEQGHVDHIVPRAYGGSNRASNLQWTHGTNGAKCNLRKGARGGVHMHRTASEIAPVSVPPPERQGFPPQNARASRVW